MKKLNKIISFALVCAMLFGTAVPVSAASTSNLKESQILLIGDSRTEGLKYSKKISKSRIVSFVGARTGSMWNNKKCNKEIKSKGKKAKKIYIALGVNDATNGSAKKTADNVISFTKKVHKCCPNAKIVVQNIIPVKGSYKTKYAKINNSTINGANKRIKAYADKTSYVSYYKVKTKINYEGDKLHFKSSTYNSIAKEVRSMLLKNSSTPNKQNDTDIYFW